VLLCWDLRMQPIQLVNALPHKLPLVCSGCIAYMVRDSYPQRSKSYGLVNSVSRQITAMHNLLAHQQL
jgi:hypothetical protein